jgi:hypothetical protein
LLGSACFLIFLAGDLLVDTTAWHLTFADATLLIVASSVAALPTIQASLDWHILKTGNISSSRAQLIVKRTHERVAAASPLTTLKNMLTDPNYDPLFSEVLAIYGIETLWLLS